MSARLRRSLVRPRDQQLDGLAARSAAGSKGIDDDLGRGSCQRRGGTIADIVAGHPRRAGRAARAGRRARRDRLRLHRRHRRGRRRPPAPSCTRRATVRPDLGSHPGKGEALWKSQFVTTGDLLVFIDADLTELGHALRHRPARAAAQPTPRRAGQGLLRPGARRRLGGGRSHRRAAGSPSWSPGRCSTCTGPSSPRWCSRWPASGRSAGRLFEPLPVPVGYGVELAALLDMVAPRTGSTRSPRSTSASARTRTSRCTTSA